MSTITRVTCGDLAALGGRWDRLQQHDPRHQDVYLDTLCHCHDHQLSESRDVECRDLLRVPVSREYLLILCCLCAGRFRDALRGVRDRALYDWLAAQCEEALEYREQRRRKPVSVSRETEAAGVGVAP